VKIRVVLLCFLLFFCLVARAAFFVPLLPGIAVAFESGAMAAGYAAAAAMVGAAIAYITFSDDEESASAGKPKMMVRFSPDAPVPTPDGWTPGVDGSDPVPPTVSPSDPIEFPPNYRAYRCNRWKNVNTISDSCGSTTVSMSDCISKYAIDSSPSFVKYCRGSDGINYTYGEPQGEFRPENSVNAAGGCPDLYETSGGTCVPPFDLPFPGDDTLVVNADNGDFVVHPRDSVDAANIPAVVAPNSVNYNKGGSNLSISPSSGPSGSAGYKITGSTTNPNGTVSNVTYEIVLSNGKYILSGGTTTSNSSGFGSNPGSEDLHESSGAACGVPGLPDCTVDDSAFSGRGDFSSAVSDIDSAARSFVDSVGDVADIDVGYSWLPSLLPGDPVVCLPLVFEMPSLSAFTIAGGDFSLDVCPYLVIVRKIFGYLFGVMTVIFVWRRFISSNS
jgi:hypothetical protein